MLPPGLDMRVAEPPDGCESCCCINGLEEDTGRIQGLWFDGSISHFLAAGTIVMDIKLCSFLKDAHSKNNLAWHLFCEGTHLASHLLLKGLP